MGSRTDKVLDALRASSVPLSRSELAARTGLYEQQVGVALKGLERYGLVKQLSKRAWVATQQE